MKTTTEEKSLLKELDKLGNDYMKLEQENKNLKEAMEVIRFLAFKHEIQDWKDATGSDKSKLDSILILSREANWAYGTTGRNKTIKEKHS